MAFTRPTLQELIDRIEADFVSRLTGGGALLRRSLAKVLARVLAGASHHLYGYIAWMLKQVIVDTAETTYLNRWCRIWGITRNPAEFAQGNVTFTGTNGTTIDAGTELQASNGAIYTTDAEGTIFAGVATIAVTAQDAGEDGNLEASTELTLVSPISGVDSTVTVDGSGLTGGVDEELDEALLDRLLNRIRRPPNGGSENDYITWAREVSGVTRAWVNPQQLGFGTLTVLFVCDDLDPIIPDADKIAEVQDYIDDPSRKPVTADVTVGAPTAVPLNPNITITPNTSAVKEAVESELRDLLTREAEPGSTLKISRIREAISQATGETDHVLNSPVADITYTDSQVGTLGTITWS